MLTELQSTSKRIRTKSKGLKIGDMVVATVDSITNSLRVGVVLKIHQEADLYHDYCEVQFVDEKAGHDWIYEEFLELK